MSVRVDTETAFEEEIVASMLAAGWFEGSQTHYQAEYALDTGQLFRFIGASQPDAWDTLVAYAGGDQTVAMQQFVRFLARELDERGALDVLRNGVKDRGVRINLAYFRPAHTVAEDALEDYRKNQLQQAAVASRNEGDFELPFNSRFPDLMVDRAEADTRFTQRFFSDNEFRGRLTREARRAAYRMIRRQHGLAEAA